ncbi:MAG: hypothetical protein SFT81_06430 [Candidatus Caenarcaniphilales bacterium]|nr:hypothetical protein [Candidatus Caenarcaniphilales bacterium]
MLLVLLTPSVLTGCGGVGEAKVLEEIKIKKIDKPNPIMKAESAVGSSNHKDKRGCAKALDEAYDMAGSNEALSDEIYLADNAREAEQKAFEMTEESAKLRMTIKEAIRLCY